MIVPDSRLDTLASVSILIESMLRGHMHEVCRISIFACEYQSARGYSAASDWQSTLVKSVTQNGRQMSIIQLH